jgi:hypothetical protein
MLSSKQHRNQQPGDLILCQLPPAAHVLVPCIAELLQHVFFLLAAGPACPNDISEDFAQLDACLVALLVV